MPYLHTVTLSVSFPMYWQFGIGWQWQSINAMAVVLLLFFCNCCCCCWCCPNSEQQTTSCKLINAYKCSVKCVIKRGFLCYSTIAIVLVSKHQIRKRETKRTIKQVKYSSSTACVCVCLCVCVIKETIEWVIELVIESYLKWNLNNFQSLCVCLCEHVVLIVEFKICFLVGNRFEVFI